MNTEKKINKKEIAPEEKRARKLQAALLAVMLLLICVCVILAVSSERDYSDFLEVLGERESSGRYDAENRFGYLGKYQMGESALQDAGFLDADGCWTELANSYGIFSEGDFLDSPKGQDAAVTAYHRKLCRYIKNYRLEQYVGMVYCGVEVTESGLLAACHLVGVKSMCTALENDEMTFDGNRTPASDYMELFSGFDISAVWDR